MAIFLNLPEIAINKESISSKSVADKWVSRTYSTKLGEGVMVYAAQSVYPEPLRLRLNLCGMHRIYVGVLKLHAQSYGHIKLSDDLCFTGIKPSPHGNPKGWMHCEYAEEIYWKTADLTNQDVILEKAKGATADVPVFLWIRCEEMTDEEISLHNEIIKNKKPVIQAHIDPDPFLELEMKNEEDRLIKLYQLKDSNVDFCMIETWHHRDLIKRDSIPMNSLFLNEWEGLEWAPEKVYAPYHKFAEENNITLYSSTRMSPGLFWNDENNYNKNFFEDHPEYYCVNRDMTVLKVCSYAFEEVQDYMLEEVLYPSKGFKGVSLNFVRGIHIGFEKPVIDRFMELYPDVDPFVLPVSDERLHGVWGEFMTAFMRKLRDRLPKEMKINVLSDYSLLTSKYMGIDVETWAKEGLIDSASQCDMEIYEDLEGCMDGDVIDLEKYKEKLLDKPILRRHYGTNTGLVYPHIAEYEALYEKYGIEVYHILPWVNSVPMEKYHEIAEEMKKLGARKFIAFNTNHVVYNLPELHYILNIGDEKKEDIIQSRYYRMLSYEDGGSMTHALTTWRG